MYRTAVTALCVAALLCIVMTGCSGSGEAGKNSEQTTASLMVAEMGALRSANDSLHAVIAKDEQDNAALTARATDCDKQVADLRAQISAMTPPPAPAPKHTMNDSRAAYQEALELFKSRKYADAQDRFQAILDNGAPWGLDDNCVYWIGECLFAQKQFSRSIEQFRRVFGFERSEKKDDAQIMIAVAYAALGDKEHAKEEYERFARRFPASPYIALAKTRLARM